MITDYSLARTSHRESESVYLSGDNAENSDSGGDLQTQAGAKVGRGSAVDTFPYHRAHLSQVFDVRSLVFGRQERSDL
jgi:hypothetical protein